MTYQYQIATFDPLTVVQLPGAPGPAGPQGPVGATGPEGPSGAVTSVNGAMGQIDLTSTYNNKNLPLYVSTAASAFDQSTGLYNVTKTNNRTFATALGAAMAGTGACHDVFIGASDMAALDGSGLKAPISWPEFYRKTLAAVGVATGGDGIFPCQDTTGAADSRLVYSANQWASFQGDFVYTTTNGATCTYTVGNGGGQFFLTYDNGSGKPAFTVKIGAASAVTVTPNGTNTIGVYSPAGAVAAGTQVVITAAGNTVLYHIGTFGTTGYHKHNLARSAMGATRAADSTYFTNSVLDGAWDPTIATVYNQPAQQSYTALADAGFTVHRVTISLLANDLVGGKTASQVTAGLTNIISKFPNATVRIVVPWQFTTISNFAWETAAAALWAYADANNYQLVDWRYILGNFSTMNAAGCVGADGIHVKQGPQANFGRSLALADMTNP